MEIHLCACGFIYWRRSWNFSSCDGHLWYFAIWCNFGRSPVLFGNGSVTQPWCHSQTRSLSEPTQKGTLCWGEYQRSKPERGKELRGFRAEWLRSEWKRASSGSKAPALEEKHQMAKTKQTKKKEDEFSESDHEQARFGTNIVSTGIYRFLFVEYMCWVNFTWSRKCSYQHGH